MTRTSSDFPVDPGQHVMIGLRVSSCAGARCERGIEYPGDHAGYGESGCLVLRCGIRSHTLRRENSDRPSAGRRDGGRHMDCPPAGRIGVLGHRGSGQRLLRRHRQCGSRCREGLGAHASSDGTLSPRAAERLGLAQLARFALQFLDKIRQRLTPVVRVVPCFKVGFGFIECGQNLGSGPLALLPQQKRLAHGVFRPVQTAAFDSLLDESLLIGCELHVHALSVRPPDPSVKVPARQITEELEQIPVENFHARTWPPGTSTSQSTVRPVDRRDRCVAGVVHAAGRDGPIE